MKALFMLGRLVFGGYFLYNGINHFQHHDHMTQYAKSKDVPLPGAAVPFTGALLIAGGASLLLGVKPKYGAMAIIGFLAGVSPVMHNFWRLEDPIQREAEMVNFTKNMALLGAALALGSAAGMRGQRKVSEETTARPAVLKTMPQRQPLKRKHGRPAAA